MTLQETLVLFSRRHNLNIFDIDGQVCFTIYGSDGGPTVKSISYFTREKWPRDGLLGRENAPVLGIMAVEFPGYWNEHQLETHLEEKLKEANLIP